MNFIKRILGEPSGPPVMPQATAKQQHGFVEGLVSRRCENCAWLRPVMSATEFLVWQKEPRLHVPVVLDAVTHHACYYGVGFAVRRPSDSRCHHWERKSPPTTPPKAALPKGEPAS